jgi:hypothetical protein
MSAVKDLLSAATKPSESDQLYSDALQTVQETRRALEVLMREQIIRTSV